MGNVPDNSMIPCKRLFLVLCKDKMNNLIVIAHYSQDVND